MPPVALLDLSGRYTRGDVSLSWKFPPQAPDTVYICPIYGADAARRANTAEMSELLLRDATSGTRFAPRLRSPHDVTLCEFLVFLGRRGEPLPNLEKLLDNPAYTVTVTVGAAVVYYQIKTQKAENGFEKHDITLQSAYSIEQGILGYSFMSGGRRYSAAFPGAIGRGKSKFPPFFTREGANVQVEVVSGANSDVSAVAKKLSGFPF